jgi:cellulose synthase/poly-beta-1,6-N-acetylglucosamine synthase-like glycosyltransferase
VLYLFALYGLISAILAVSRVRGTPGRRRSFRPFLSLLVLVKEGETYVEGLVRNLAGLPYLNRAGLTNYDVVVVDEHSVDQTAQIIERLARRYGNVRFARAGHGAGRAAAIEAGLRLCRGRTAILLDATNRAETTDLLRTVYYLVGPKDEPAEAVRPPSPGMGGQGRGRSGLGRQPSA